MNQPIEEPTFSLLSTKRGTVLVIALLSMSISMFVMLWAFGLVALVVAAATRVSPFLSRRATTRFTLLAGLVTWLVTLPRGPLSLFSASIWLIKTSTWVGVAAVAVFGLAIVASKRSNRMPTLLWLLVGAWVVGSGVAAIVADPQTWIDVFALHADAGSAMLDLESPYGGRTVPNPMAQLPEGSIYEGYVYPPISLFTFALTDALLGDSRWVTLACGVALVWTVRRLSTSAVTDAIGVLFLVTPGWPLMVQMSWTEPLSVLLLAVAFVSTSGSRTRAALIGLFIGSKQYLLVTALPILASWWRRRQRSIWITGSVAMAAYAVGLLFGPSTYLEWVFVFHLTLPPPPFGANIPGLAEMLLGIHVTIPSAVSLAVGSLAAIAVAMRRPRTDATMILGMTIGLTVIFAFGYQAFPNYWYQILGLLTVGALVGARGVTEQDDGTVQTPRVRHASAQIP